MKRMLLTLTAAGVLAVPVGVVAAQATDDGTTVPVPTTVEPETVRAEIRREDGVGVQVRTRTRTEAHAQDGVERGEAARTQTRAQDRDAESLPVVRAGDQDRTMDRAQDRPRDGSCLEGDAAAATSGDQDRTRDRLQDDSCDRTGDRDRLHAGD